ncbi:N-acetylmuramoyl-L-alanine amidase [Yokenella regensburgei]|uniref:N-acetylmuramoyl-L-alanine amidase n=1 Tax=Yokenella regensburgei TaxID=158877 RepID=A0ABX9S195_9ENTR|nr:N-acetylmuramoyl-L-alanine amidase [Yokenella regensburgei]RKR64460.1 N-acetylmuramoyl-L-alanine amidase [Yokenella regensburgei]
MDRKTTRRQIILAGLATLAANALVTPFAHAQAQKRLIHPHSPSPTHGRGKYTVMLDPGHGGIDSGAVGHEGSLEKHVVLEIANNVKNLLKGHGIDAFLTRTDDTFIPLYDRVQIAHAHNASLFMSIHADGFTSPAAHGASVFALSTRGASSAMAKYLAKSENAADEVAGNRAMHKDKYLDRIIFDLEQTETIKESLLLGSHIVRHISPVHPMHSRQTEQAAFVVLKSPYIPSVLVETSFITNPEEERLLGTTAFRYKIASAITNGIVSYFGRKQIVSA